MNKLIIIAAGTGSRLMPYTKNTPKPLIKISGNKSILEWALDQVVQSKVIDKVIIVVGYLAEQIEEKIKEIKDIKINTAYTPYFEVSGNLHSLWFAEHEMDGKDNIFITNADNIIDAAVYQKLAKQKLTTYAVCRNKQLKDDDMKVLIEGDDIINVSKDIKNCEIESVSLVKIPADKVLDFRKELDKMIRNKENILNYWPSIFYQMFQDGMHTKPMVIAKDQWSEIDFHGDLIEVIKKKMK